MAEESNFGEYIWPSWLTSFIQNLGQPDTLPGAGMIGDWLQTGIAPNTGIGARGGAGMPATVSAVPSVSRQPNPSPVTNYGGPGGYPAGPYQPGQFRGPPSATKAGQGAQPGLTDWNGLMGQWNEQRQIMADQRAAAIRAAGRGAGAPYAAEIARIDAEIAKAQKTMAGSNQLFANKIDATNQWWDQSISKLGLSYDASIDRTRTINATGGLAIDQVYSEGQARVLSVLDNIPGMDETTKSAAVGIVSDLEDEIINMDEVSGESALTVMQAAEDLAVAMAGQSKANTALEFTRQRITIEAQLKEQINSMLESRKAASRAQAAAMQAARDLEAARLPDNFPLNEAMLAAVAGNDYLNRELGNMRQVDKDKIVNAFGSLYGLGISPTDARKLLTPPVYNISTGAAQNASAMVLEQYNMSEENWYQTFGSWNNSLMSAARRYMPYALQLGQQATTVWNSFKGLDPNQYSPNSAEYAFIVAANYGSWMSPDELGYAIENTGDYLTPVPGSSAPTSTTYSGQSTDSGRIGGT